MPKSTTIAAYTGVFLLVMSLVAVGYRPPQESGQVANLAETAPVNQPQALEAPSVDELFASGIAADLAQTAKLPIAGNVAELSASLTVRSQLAQNNDSIINKPQIVQPTSSNREITNYKVVDGDSLESIAKDYGVTSQTIQWANDLSSNAVTVGSTLTIPPVDGVVYTVESGDSLASIADKYNVSEERIVTFNDLEITGLTNGAKLVLPGGTLPETERPGYVATPAYSFTPAPGTPSAPSRSFGGGFMSGSVGNRYAWGNCTYYVYDRRAELGRPIGSFWGNAKNWVYSAQSAGFAVNGTPAAGSIFVDQAGYYGHVGLVESVNSDGSLNITEMNNYAYGGFNIVKSRTIPAGEVGLYQYIH